MHNNKTCPTAQAERRRFLKSLAGASATLGLAAAAGQALAAPQAAEPSDEAPAAQGYQETQHIRDYYASCR